jgi:hypothetical protein
VTDLDTFVRNGDRVAEILRDEAFETAVEAVRRKYIDASLAGKTVEEREAARTAYAVLGEVLSQLKVIVGRGEMAQAELDRQADREKPS